jgi:hypothetical protein
MIESSTILSYITSVRLGTGEWQGTTESFILHWQNQVRLYERQVPLSDHFSDGQKRTMLENAVAPIEELRQVKNNADMEKTKTGVVLSYENYASLLLSAATSYDNQHKTSRHSKRQVYLHDFYDDLDMNQDEDEEYNNDYDIDIPVATLQANVHDSKTKKKMSLKSFPQCPRMSHDKWFSLSEAQRLIWDQLDDKAKAIILGISKPQPSSQRQVNLHEISVFDFCKLMLTNWNKFLSWILD